MVSYWKKYRNYIIVFILCCLYLTFFSAFTSPLFPKYVEWDSAIFMLVGKGIISGKKMYVDIFDHKGPILFLIQSFGMLGGRYLFFFVQSICMTFTICILRKISELLYPGNTKMPWVFMATYGILLAYPLGNGNLSEEYCLPLIMCSIYLALKDIYELKIPRYIHCFFYGVFFAIMAFIRINNAVIVVGIILYWILFLVWKRQWKLLCVNIALGLLGFGCVSGTICLYFVQNHSFKEMIYATFGFNLLYATNSNLFQTINSISGLARVVLLFLPMLGALLVIWKKIDDKMCQKLYFVIIILSAISLSYGQGYKHYFMVVVPITSVIIGQGLYTERNRVICWILYGVLTIYLLFGIRTFYQNIDDYYLNKWVIDQCDTIAESMAKIPQEERGSVIGFDIPAKYYLFGDILPCYKYGFFQTHWSNDDPEIMNEFLEFIYMESPDWVITEKHFENEKLQKVIDDKYCLEEEDSYCNYYRIDK